MISFLQGKIFQKNERNITLLVNNIGYKIFLNQLFLSELKLEQEARFFFYTHIKDDAFDLYGFRNTDELEFFIQLLSVSGVGPKSAVNILGLAKLNDLKKAITSGDPSILQKVAGIGKKTAERLVVELKEKIITDLSEAFILGDDDNQVVEALVSLGYKEKDIKVLIKDLKLEGSLADQVKMTLRSIN
mgnify:FL=1